MLTGSPQIEAVLLADARDEFEGGAAPPHEARGHSVGRLGGGGRALLAGEDAVFPLPEDCPVGEALLAPLVASALQVARAIRPRRGAPLAVFGLDLAGNLLAQVLRGQGAVVLAVGVDAARAAAARACGLEHVALPEQVGTLLRELGERRRPRVVLARSGHARCLEGCLAACEQHGQVLMLAPPRWSTACDAVELLREIHFRWLHLRPLVPAPTNETLGEALHLLRGGGLRTEGLLGGAGGLGRIAWAGAHHRP
jgi:threonine dehydrogenase-like Zn-dependent dehydrogenase